MPLEITEGAVVAEHVEAVVGALERAPGLCRRLARSPTYACTKRDAIVGRKAPAHPVEKLRLGKVRVRVTDRRENLVFAFGIPVEEVDGRLTGLGLALGEDARDQIGGVVAGLGEVGGPGAAAVGTVDTASGTTG